MYGKSRQEISRAYDEVGVREPPLSLQGSGGLHRYSVCALAVVLCFSYLDLPNYIYTLNEAFLPKYFYYAFFIAVTPLLASRSSSLGEYLMSPFSRWAFALILLNLLHLLDALVEGDHSRVSIIYTRTQYAVLALVLALACSATRPASFTRVFPFLAVMLPALVLFDFISPGVLYPLDMEGATPGRAGGTLINPNRAGEAMLLTFVLAIPVLRPRYRAALLLLLGAAVIVTFGRAAIVGWILLWAFLLTTKVVPRYTLVLLFVVLGVFPLLAGSFENYLRGREDIAEGLANIETRLEFFQNQVLEDDSALARGQVFEGGVQLFRTNPIIGAGAGTTYLWALGEGTHNVPVMLGAEYGVLGIALWLWLIVILWRGNYFHDKKLQAAMAAGFVFLSMFTHNMLDSLYWLLTFAIVAGHQRA